MSLGVQHNTGDTSLSPRDLIHRQFLTQSNLSENTHASSQSSGSLSQIKNPSSTHSKSLKDRNKSVKFISVGPASSSSCTDGSSAGGGGYTSTSTTSSISRLRRLSIKYDKEHPSEHPRSQIQRQFMEGIDEKIEVEADSTSKSDMKTTNVCDIMKENQTEPMKTSADKTLQSHLKAESCHISNNADFNQAKYTSQPPSFTVTASATQQLSAGVNLIQDENSPLSSGMSTPTVDKSRGSGPGRRNTEKMQEDEVDQLLKVLEQRNLDPDPGPTEEYHPDDPESAPDIFIYEDSDLNNTDQTKLQFSSEQFKVEDEDEIVEPNLQVVTSTSNSNMILRLNHKPTVSLFANATKLDFTDPKNLLSIRGMINFATTSKSAGSSSCETRIATFSNRTVAQAESSIHRSSSKTYTENYCNLNSALSSITHTSRGSIEDRMAVVEANILRRPLSSRPNFESETLTMSVVQKENIIKYQRGYLNELRGINEKFALNSAGNQTNSFALNSISSLQTKSSNSITKAKKEDILRRIYGTRCGDRTRASQSGPSSNRVTLADIRSLEREILTSREYQSTPRRELPYTLSTEVGNRSSTWGSAVENRSTINQTCDEDEEELIARAGGRNLTCVTPPPVPECGTPYTTGAQGDGNVPVRQLDWAAGPGGGDEDDEVPVTDSGLFDFDYTWPGILKKTKKILKKEHDWSSSSSSSSDDDKKKKKKKKKSSKKDAEKRKMTREASKKDMSKTMTDLWDREASNMEDIKNRNKAGIYGRLQRMKNYVDLTDDSIYFKEIVQDGMEMFKFFYDQVFEFVKGIKISGKNPSLLRDAYESVTTELLALINLAELGTYMDIEEDALLTALEDFEQALKDFDRLLRALVISISK